jgi:SAM-dependent methyltransferase
MEVTDDTAMDLIRRAIRRPQPPQPPVRPVRPTTRPSLQAKDELHDFWRNPDVPNRPERYLEHVGRSEFLLGFVTPYLGTDPAILEIGCNVGRNLAHLFDAGYRRVTGIEINTDALTVLRDTYPAMAAVATLVNAPVEEAIREMPDASIDLVFTMAVLEHIHPDSEWIFDEMVRISRSTIVTIEDELGVSRHHVPRDYRVIFETRGMRQVAHRSLSKGDHGFGTAFEARAFVWPELQTASS